MIHLVLLNGRERRDIQHMKHAQLDIHMYMYPLQANKEVA